MASYQRKIQNFLPRLIKLTCLPPACLSCLIFRDSLFSMLKPQKTFFFSLFLSHSWLIPALQPFTNRDLCLGCFSLKKHLLTACQLTASCHKSISLNAIFSKRPSQINHASSVKKDLCLLVLRPLANTQNMSSTQLTLNKYLLNERIKQLHFFPNCKIKELSQIIAKASLA